MEFIAVDVETANADMSSICQIGIAHYCDGKLLEEWVTYINPKDDFDYINISIHGINEKTVRKSPVFSDIAEKIYSYFDDRIVVCHTHFDRVAIKQAFDKNCLRHSRGKWLDSARVARRTWEQFAFRGYGLGNICEYLNYEFKHHDALEDAKACAFILIKAIAETGIELENWPIRITKPIDLLGSSIKSSIKREGNPDGILYGDIMVFTGALEMPRREAADLASKVGCQVGAGVTKKTTLLVVGDQDITKLAGNKKSSKHRKAEELISKGQKIRIIRESDFIELVNLED